MSKQVKELIGNMQRRIANQRAEIARLTEENEKLTKKCDLRQKDLDNTWELVYKAEDEIKKLTEEKERLRAKQTPQKPRNTRREIVCPSCSTLIGSHPYCAYCGQAIDWSKESEGE